MQITFNPSITNNRQCKKQTPAFRGYYLEKVVPLKGLDGDGLGQRMLDSDSRKVLRTTPEELLDAYKKSDEVIRGWFEDLFVLHGMEYPPKI